jgi:hypothetical protein
VSELYYDPYDFEIDADPHPVWRRMREEAPLYRNDKHDFWALSRFDDVEAGLLDWRSYSSARGSVLEIIKSGVKMPPGMFIFEDPPIHDVHRSVLARAFTPRRMAASGTSARSVRCPIRCRKRRQRTSSYWDAVPMRVIAARHPEGTRKDPRQHRRACGPREGNPDADSPRATPIDTAAFGAGNFPTIVWRRASVRRPHERPDHAHLRRRERRRAPARRRGDRQLLDAAGRRRQ